MVVRVRESAPRSYYGPVTEMEGNNEPEILWDGTNRVNVWLFAHHIMFMYAMRRVCFTLVRYGAMLEGANKLIWF